MFLLFLLNIAFGTTLAMDCNPHLMTASNFCEEMAQGTLLEASEIFSLETYQNALMHAAASLNKFPDDFITKTFHDMAYYQEIPSTFTQLDTFVIPAYTTSTQQEEIKKIIRAAIYQRAQEKHSSVDIYFNDLKAQIYLNRKNLINAIERKDTQQIAQFRTNKEQYPWHLLHLLSSSDWATFKRIAQPLP